MQTACEDRLAEIQERQETLREYSADLERENIAAGQHLSTTLVAHSVCLSAVQHEGLCLRQPACCVCFPHAVMHLGEGLHQREPARYVCFCDAAMHQ